MTYHVIIKTERRQSPREKAVEIADGQLHIMGASITDTSNLVYAASWNGVSPFVDVVYPADYRTALANLKHRRAGWPMVDRRDYVP